LGMAAAARRLHYALWSAEQDKQKLARGLLIDDFKRWFRGKWMTVEGEDIVAVVGRLRGGELIFEIGAFVREVQCLTEERRR
jgi:hypothetical protein